MRPRQDRIRMEGIGISPPAGRYLQDIPWAMGLRPRRSSLDEEDDGRRDRRDRGVSARCRHDMHRPDETHSHHFHCWLNASSINPQQQQQSISKHAKPNAYHLLGSSAGTGWPGWRHAPSSPISFDPDSSARALPLTNNQLHGTQ